MRALGFEPKKEEIKKMIADIDKDGTGKHFASIVCCIDFTFPTLQVPSTSINSYR